MNEKLKNIAELSRKYGSNPDYVFLGGGNTSVKNDEFLFVKPSGVALATIQAEQFLKVDRQQLNKLFDTPLPENSQIREAFAKAMLESAVRPLGAGRPSVETPLHNIIDYTYIVHLHPALVNGMTCAINGPETARRLFPEALWIDYCDAGCKLAFVAKEALDKDTARRGHQPNLIFLQNHGIFVGANSPEELDRLYDHVFSVLRQEYEKAGIETAAPELGTPETGDVNELAPAFRQLLADEDGNRPVVSAVGCTLPYGGPLTPDHIVYAKSFAFVGDPTTEAMKHFKDTYGYLPKVIGVPGRALFTAGASVKETRNVAIAVANALQVQHLADAFGGPKFMTPREYQFIENWEVESYRRSVANAGKTPKRLDHKVALVILDEQTPIQDIPQELARNGAIVAIAHPNADLAAKIAQDICNAQGPLTAFPVQFFKNAEHATENAIDEVTRICGGMDLVLDATGSDTQFQWTLKHASRILARQQMDGNGSWTDIVKIDSADENTPCQDTASQLIPLRIKLNHIAITPECQKNTPPMGREATTRDLLAAVLYCVEQQAETAQTLTLSAGRRARTTQGK